MAPLALAQLVVPGMRERHWGRIVGIASTSVREPIGVLMLSNAERSATLAAFKTLALELARDGITVNTLLTGSIATERAASMHGSMQAAEQAAAARVPVGRIGGPRRWDGPRRSSAPNEPRSSPGRRSPSTAARCAGSDRAGRPSRRGSGRELAWVGGHIDRMLAEDLKRHDLERALVR